MAGQKEQRRAKTAEKNEKKKEKASTWYVASSGNEEVDSKTRSDVFDSPNNNVVTLPAQEFYQHMDDEMNIVPEMGGAFDGITRNCVQYGTIPSFTRRFGAIPSLRGKTLVWLQLLLADEQKTAQVKLYALGSRVALAKDDSNVVERSRTLFKDSAPSFMEDYGLWIISRSLVRKGYDGLIGDAVNFSPYDPLDNLSELPMDPSLGVRCAEIFLFFAVDPNVPGDVMCSREAVMAFLDALNSEDGTNKLHAFYVTAGSVVATREKLRKLRGNHLTA